MDLSWLWFRAVAGAQATNSLVQRAPKTTTEAERERSGGATTHPMNDQPVIHRLHMETGPPGAGTTVAATAQQATFTIDVQGLQVVGGESSSSVSMDLCRVMAAACAHVSGKPHLKPHL